MQIAANVECLNANPQRGFIVGGVSAGATSSIAASHLYRDENLSPPLTGLYLSVPGLLFEAVPEKYQHEYTSHLECGDAPIMNTEDLGLLMLGTLRLITRYCSL
jgi:acetyl esterase/lipase